MTSQVLLSPGDIQLCSRACTSMAECNTEGAVICGSGWHTQCDHGICTCALDGQILGCLADRDCNDGLHLCQDPRSQWRCVLRDVNGVSRNVCTCLRN
ncbi:hypothetical protein ACJMK2_004596 [Sinanodonta woodiana]|uniref:Uncharacterized protein n=1 Tax=Sinanodonta woodiana TaxID=1069815 RepID=A0ABD3Y1N4_SINWO